MIKHIGKGYSNELRLLSEVDPFLGDLYPAILTDVEFNRQRNITPATILARDNEARKYNLEMDKKEMDKKELKTND